MQAKNTSDLWSSESNFISFCLKLLRSKDIDQLTLIINDPRSVKFSSNILFKDMLSDSIQLGGNRDNCTVPLYDQDVMPGNFRGLDVYGLLRSEKDVDTLTFNKSFEYTVLKCFETTPSTITILSCDSSYFNLYFHDAINSFREHRLANDALSIHICNPDEIVLKTVAEIQDDWVLVTTETRHNVTPAYHACTRYLIANELITKHMVPVIISDIDVKFHSSPSVVKSLLNPPPNKNPDRIDLCVDEPPNLPWQIFLAGFVYVRPTTSGVRFLNIFSNLCQYIFSKDLKSYWYIDQNILYFIFSRDFCYAKAWGARDLILRASDRFSKEKLVVRGKN